MLWILPIASWLFPNYNFQMRFFPNEKSQVFEMKFCGKRTHQVTCVALMSLQRAKKREALWPVKLVHVFVCVRETVCAQACNGTIHAGHPLILTPLLASVLCQCKPICQVDFSVLLRVCCSGSLADTGWIITTREHNRGCTPAPWRSVKDAFLPLFVATSFFPTTLYISMFSNRQLSCGWWEVCLNQSSFPPFYMTWRICQSNPEISFFAYPISSIWRNMAEIKLPCKAVRVSSALLK